MESKREIDPRHSLRYKPYDKNKIKPSYKQLEEEIKRISLEFAKLAYEHYMFKRAMVNCKCNSSHNEKR
jgi:hypothetical protein